ncbi:MAG: PspC domain-containing protein [Bacteroidota bacterium]|nr:PspC domain-containing protein [Bacteroidota bacterium]
MNKTININLGGYSFIIDEDAYETANHYLHTLSRHFRGGDGADEIMQDIESRMGELINRNKGATRVIVNKLDVANAIAVLGTPEELKDMNFAENINDTKRQTGEPFQLKTGKRLYRDPNDKVLGGVCSGLAAYFGIQDTVWVRVAFVLLALAGGASFIVYCVLWGILPKAKTVSDRLEMMGEPTNVNNIARMVKEELEDLSDKIQDKFGKKHKQHRYQHHQADKDDDQILTSGWSWNSKPCRSKMKAPFNSKDYV